MAELNGSRRSCAPDVSEVTLEDIVSACGLAKERLQEECSREIILKIATKLEDWKMVGLYLKLPFEKLKAIELENHTEDQRKVAMLDTWKKGEGKDANYMKLVNVLYQRGRRDLVESLCKAAAAQSSEPSTKTVNTKVQIGSAATMDIDRWDPESSKYIPVQCNGNYAPVNCMPHYPPPRPNHGEPGGIDRVGWP